MSQNNQKNQNNQNNHNQIIEHLTHYKKINLSKDISIRYFYTFQDNKSYENKWVLKSHKQKKATVIGLVGVELLLELHKKDINEYDEIIGKIKNGEYQKIIIKSSGKIKTKIEKKDNSENSDPEKPEKPEK